jgi:nitroimidazol reductase NimA-like FMN-containing flavoprotein (pyridoxamine 5'-phosphate oxidase superfamily)
MGRAPQQQELAMNREERRAFVAKHRTAVFGTNRKSDGPAQSIVYYVSDGDDLLLSTMGERAKAKAVERLGKVSLCVLDEQWPPSYLVVYCNAKGRGPEAHARARQHAAVVSWPGRAPAVHSCAPATPHCQNPKEAP